MSALWLLPPNISVHALRNISQPSIDCINVTGQWGNKVKRTKVYRDYISVKRPFLTISDEFTSVENINLDDYGLSKVLNNMFFSNFGDWEKDQRSLYIWGNPTLNWARNNTRSDEREETKAYLSEVNAIGSTLSEIGVAGDGDLNRINNLATSTLPFENIYISPSHSSGQKLSEILLDDLELSSCLSSDWCEKANTHTINLGSISVGSVGGIMNGTIPLNSHYHNKLLAGIKIWYLLPSMTNMTKREEAIKVVFQQVREGVGINEIVCSILPTLKESVDIHTVMQYTGDIIYIPPGWAFFTINILPAVSAGWNSCLINEALSNCEAHSVLHPVSA